MVTLTFAGRYDNLARICEFVKKEAIKAGLDDAAVYQVETAIDEACTNIIEHGYKKEDIGDIECSCEAQSTGLYIEIKDRCQLFNPDRIAEPDIQAPLKKRATHGLGLYFIRKMMDEVKFEYKPGEGNILTMVKYKGK